MNIFYLIIVFFTFLAGESKNLKFSTFFIMLNSLFISVAVLFMGYIYGILSFYFIFFIDLLVRTLIIPLLIFKSLRNRSSIEIKPAIIHPLSIALSIVILSLTYHFVNIMRFNYFIESLPSVTCGITLFVYGFYLLAAKNDIFKMVLSFFIIENGIHLIMISLIPSMPKLIEIALTFNFVLAVLFFFLISTKLYETYVTEEIEKLRKTKMIYRLED